MLFIQIVFIIICCLITKSIPNSVVRKIMLFFELLYSLQIVLAIIDPLQVHPIGLSTILMFNLQLLFFPLGARAFMNNNVKRVAIAQNNELRYIEVNSVLFYIQIVVFLITLYNYNRMQAYMGTLDGLTNLSREYYYSGFYSGAELMLNSFLDGYRLISVYLLYQLLFFRKRKLSTKEIIFIVLGVATLVLSSMTSMGRAVILKLAILLILVYFLSQERAKEKTKTIKRSALIILVISAAVIVGTTLIRFNYVADEAGDIIKESYYELLIEPFIEYFYVPIQAFDFGKDTILNFNVPFMGGAELAGIIDFLMTPLVVLDHAIGDYTINNIIGARMTPQFFFETGQGWNALFTGASNYYIDLGWFGFIVFPFLHGFLLALFTIKSRYSTVALLLLVFLFDCSFSHLTSSGIQSMRTAFYFIWVFLIIRLSRSYTKESITLNRAT